MTDGRSNGPPACSSRQSSRHCCDAQSATCESCSPRPNGAGSRISRASRARYSPGARASAADPAAHAGSATGASDTSNARRRMHEPIWIGAPDADLARPSAAPVLARAAADREPLARQARGTNAGRQLLRCFPRWRQALDHLRWAALVRLTRDEPIDPNDPDAWAGRDQHAHAVLRRHGITGVAPARLTLQAIGRLIDAQAAADREAGLDWTRITTPARALDAALRRAHARLGIDLDEPAVWTRRADQRAALTRPRPLSRSGRRPVALGARAARRLRCRRPALLAHRVGHMAAAGQSTATGSGHRRPSRRRVRRASAGRERVATGARALARRDPANRRARRDPRPRPHRRHAAR